MTVNPKKKIQIQVGRGKSGQIFVSAKEDLRLKCDFEVEQGCMIKRNLVEHMEGKVFIAPIFKNGIITMVTCDDCGPNFGVKPQYKVIPLAKPDRTIKISNHTNYDIIIWEGSEVRKIIEAKTSKSVGISSNSILYIDTVFEEITWKDSYNIYESAILRVNGCCIKIDDGNCSEYVSVIGPALSEPYIRHLYASFRNEVDIEIWCNTIDFRLE